MPHLAIKKDEMKKRVTKFIAVKLSGWRWVATRKRKFKMVSDCLKFLLAEKHGFGKEFLNLEGKIYCNE